MLNKKAMSAAFAPTGAATDPYFPYTTMLLHGDGTNGAQNNTFIDGSTNNFTITRNGNTTQGSINPFGDRWSNYFDGSGDYLSAATTTGTNLTGDFTVEGWAWIDSTVASSRPDNAKTLTFLNANGATSGVFGFFISGTTTTPGTGLEIYQDSPSYSAAVSVSVPLNQWVHIAFVRTGTTIYGFVNGTRYTFPSTSSSTFGSSSGGCRIGALTGSSYFGYWKGYISNVRVVKGTAVYTANFTPPTAPLAAITNTSLLTCNSNRFKDSSSNNFTITRNGDVSVRPFNPFSPSAAYSTGTNGGSGYFDGNGDYLGLPANAAFNFGTGDFTIEFFAYRVPGGSSDKFFVDQANSVQYLLRYNGAGQFQFYTGGSMRLQYTLTTWIGYWSHIVVVRTGTTLSMFIDGVRVATATNSSAIGSDGQTVGIGAKNTGGTDFFPGYISNLRIVKDDVYDATQTTLTVPTAPLTAITNTSLLLNFTNGGIIDNTADNVLETVGNAQISTSVKKYGTGSLAFDGSGDYLFAPNSPDLSFGTGDFTIEYWIYPTSWSPIPVVVDTRATGSSTTGYSEYYSSSGNFNLFLNNTTVFTSPNTVSLNTWTHIAVSRQGTSIRVFINGTQSGSTLTNSTNMSDKQCLIGVNVGLSGGISTNFFTGYIDDLRITKGVARYTANFTPPTAAFPDL